MTSRTRTTYDDLMYHKTIKYLIQMCGLSFLFIFGTLWQQFMLINRDKRRMYGLYNSNGWEGGVGKTTLGGFLIRYLIERRKGPILAVDADANSNLHEVLGVTVDQQVGTIREDSKHKSKKKSWPALQTWTTWSL